jgi:hypothetical protein
MKGKQQWLGLYEDEARWLARVVDLAASMNIGMEQRDLCGAVASKLRNMVVLYPRRRPTKKKEDK